MPLDLQSKLLRALETKCFSPVGSSREIEVDFRLICATHKNLYKQVVLKNFRSDLFFRISAFPIRVPALKDRPGDIENLVYHLAQQLTLSDQSNMKFELEGDALWLLKTFSWPGNVRQLRNVIECLIIRSGGQAINAIQVQQVLREQNEQGLNAQGSPAQQALKAEESNRSPLDSVTDYRSFFVSNGKLMIAEHLKTVERKVAENRIAMVRKFDSEALQVTTAKRAEPRVAFGQLVERGMLRPGEELHSLNGRHKVKVRADGTLATADIKGSIHQVGAALEGAPSCNGWTYWCFKRDGKRVLIDQLRQQIRDEMGTI